MAVNGSTLHNTRPPLYSGSVVETEPETEDEDAESAGSSMISVGSEKVHVIE